MPVKTVIEQVAPKMMKVLTRAAADLPPGFARLPEPLRGVRQYKHNFP
ncbi:hypothetical protein [Ponticaulis sp.]|nr:hypothetical protein [Ponticaulis sp.]MDF1680345.1 hypothetical protein [Ponticaulis sp.]